ncbi:hypothetical protein GGR57DRAFT_485054 [Xylariaceae sp. FL1272]|nr:hypothetical protein GGR57DRAFT_485054 [Xylariaceae sp. FL1272]
MASVPTGYPTLKPAIIFTVKAGEVSSFGVTHTGSTLSHFTTASGTIESIPGFEPAFKGDIRFAGDWLSFDADGKHARIDFKGVAKTAEGHSIDFTYKGIIDMAPEVKMIFDGHADSKTIPFGRSTGYNTYIVSDESLKFLENSIFVTNSRIIVAKDGLTIESRQSLVVASTAMD